jgi:hypothetical protein
MTRVTLTCKVCGYRARRDLARTASCRGVHETPSEPGRCPRGHGFLVRIDGRSVRVEGMHAEQLGGSR